MKKYYFLGLLFIAFAGKAQIVNIPDANFKNALVNTPCIIDFDSGELVGDADTDNDGEIQVSEAAAVVWLNVSNQNIASLEGIQAFTGLWNLNCSHNLLSSLHLTNPALFGLDCSHNQINSLTADFHYTVDYHPTLHCNDNLLTSLTLTSPVPEYEYVDCSHNLLTSFANNAPNSHIYDLNLSYNNFETLTAYGVYLTVTNCPAMTSCNTQSNIHLTLTDNAALLSARIGSNGEADVTNNPLLQSINVKDGQVPYEDGFPSNELYLTGNPSMQFVCIDDMGNSYDEGGNVFFIHERENVHVDPGVAITYYCDLTPGGGFNTLGGTFHYDCSGSNTVVESNGVNINLDQNTNGSVDATMYPNDSGNFFFYGNGNGTITPVFDNNYFTVSPASYAYSFSGTGETQNVNFCVSPNGSHPDLEASVITVLGARPGFDAIYKIVYTNKGTQVQSGTVSLAFEDALTDLVSANPALSIQSDSLLSWDFANLSPFESREITVTLNVNSPLETPAVNSGDILDFTAVVAAGVDETPANNTFAFSNTVVNSFDPNDKSVSRSAISPTQLGEYLYYTVRFQNTGTFYAENIVVRDIISKKLDLSTLEVVSTSHPCRAALTAQQFFTEGDKLEFFFQGINLPASIDDEPGSHGFVTYRIKPKNNLVLNDVIANSAEIYFDYNSAIVTNTVTTTVTTLGTNHFNLTNNFSLYPNPAKNTLTIDLTDNLQVKSISIFNALGQLVKAIPPGGNSITADVSDLNSGTYFIQMISDKGKTSKKLIKL